jgi:dCMP deaminase
MKRLTFNDLAIEIAKCASMRSEDPFKKVGCAIFNKEGRLLSIGYNGLQPKQKISKQFWNDRDERRKYVIHAETNALSCITRYDNPSLLAITLLPCSSCAINIASFGIRDILYVEEYEKDMLAKKIFKFYNIKIKKYENN